MIKRIGIECESIEGKNPTWGVGRMLTKLLEEISQRPELGKNFRFVLYFKDNVPDFDFLNAPIFEKKKIPVPFFKNRLFPIYYFLLLPVKLWFERLDLMFWPNYMLPIIAFNKSVVMLTEDVYFETHTGQLPLRYRLAYGIFGWWAARFATKILAISETSKKNISQLYGIKSDRIFVNHLGIDIGSASTKSYGEIKSASAKATARFQHEDGYLLYVGQAFPRRHLKETILAFEKLTVEFPTLQLIVIGPDKYETPTIKPLASQLNDRLQREAVIHKDYIKEDEIADLYAKASALVYVSDKEAFGLPPMEALSFGIPPVIADNELGHELFDEYAFYAESSDTEGIYKAILNALNQTEKNTKIKNNGPEFVKKYSWRRFTEQWLNIIRSIT